MVQSRLGKPRIGDARHKDGPTFNKAARVNHHAGELVIYMRVLVVIIRFFFK